jgi:3-oxoacyl-[acyl-carrier protein] reductase
MDRTRENATSSDHPLLGKNALVTGVSRRKGIGYAIACRLAALGASVFIQHYRRHDEDQPWGADDIEAVIGGIREHLYRGSRFGELSADLGQRGAAAHVIEEASRSLGRLDILVCNHARSGGDGSIFDVDEDMLDGHFAVNARSTLMLTRRFAELYTGETRPSGATAPGVRQVRRRPIDEHATGRVIWMTSGQMDGPMPGETAYATSKAALAGVTATVASDLLSAGILLNTVNPGSVNTGYLDAETTDRPLEDMENELRSTAFGRYGAPSDPARLIGWLVSDDARWVVGQVITSDGGFRL